jgi:hypothetical protein
LKTLMPEIKGELDACGVHPQDGDKLLEPLAAVAEESQLRTGHGDSLCLFSSPREFHCFSVRAVVETGCHVEERFVVQPVLAHLDYRSSFLLLALAAKHVRLLRCEGNEIRPVPIPDGVPESVGQFLGEPEGEEHTKNHAPGVKFGSSEGREKSGYFYRDFMKAIARGLQPLLRAEALPLVLAGVPEETAAYTAVSDYVDLLPEAVKLSPDGGATGAELARAGAEILKRWSNAAETQALADFEAMGPARSSTDTAAILQAATAGKVQHLFVERGGKLVGDARRLAGLDGAEGYVYRKDDLLNAATVETLLHKGAVWLLEPEKMPESVVMAAVMRYADDKAGR